MGFLVCAITLFEFVAAQSPRPLSGVLLSFPLMWLAVCAVIGIGTYTVIGIVTSNEHSWFYSNLSLALISFVNFILFHYIAKQYKWRKRDDIVPIHLFAEEFFEKEVKGRKRFSEEQFHFRNRSNIMN